MEERKQLVIDFMREESYKPMLCKELSAVLQVPKAEKKLFQDLLEELEEEGKIYKNNKNCYGVPERMNLIVGRFQGNERGYGFLIPDDSDVKDVFITTDGLNGAMHGDRVIAKYTNIATNDKRAEGEIIKITSRANNTIVGTFEKSNFFGFVIPDDAKISGDVFIAKEYTSGAESGQKVVVQIINWPFKKRNAEGKIIEIIGDKNDPGTDILSIIKSFHLKETFPIDVEKEINDIEIEIKEEDIKDRRDLRDLTMFTIDGEDAKDLDDAVSIETIPEGYRLGVHIADVSSYVREGTHLDDEALKRGTSVYLVDRVIPMLPRKLSNGICSLNPNVNRFAFTVMMDIDSTGKVLNHEIFESVIKTNERMTYTDVYKILEHNDEELIKRYSDIVPDLKSMKELAEFLRNKRIERGAIDFDFDEAKIILDEKGEPIEIKKYERTVSNRMIEEFMLVCNETVAEHFFWAGVPFVYRIHEEPDADRIESFAEFIHNLGYSLKGVNKIHPGALQKVLNKTKGSNEEKVISTIMLRSLKKARYSSKNDIHFGLAAKYYSHFTSPIRRYPDLIIHRIMKESLNGKMTSKRIDHYKSSLPEICKLCSEREKAAEEAERDTMDLKKVQFMKKNVGDVFSGTISGVTNFGFFVEMENTIEGLVKVVSLEDDYYVYNQQQYSLIGERTGKVYRIGDPVEVLLIKASMKTRQLELILAPTDKTAGWKDHTKGFKKVSGKKSDSDSSKNIDNDSNKNDDNNKSNNKNKVDTGFKGKEKTGFKGKGKTGYRGKESTGYKGKENTGDKGKESTGYKGKERTGYKGKESTGYKGKESTGYKGKESTGYKGKESNGYKDKENAGYKGKESAGYKGKESTEYKGKENNKFGKKSNEFSSGDSYKGFGKSSTKSKSNYNKSDSKTDNTYRNKAEDNIEKKSSNKESKYDFFKAWKKPKTIERTSEETSNNTRSNTSGRNITDTSENKRTNTSTKAGTKVSTNASTNFNNDKKYKNKRKNDKNKAIRNRIKKD